MYYDFWDILKEILFGIIFSIVFATVVTWVSYKYFLPHIDNTPQTNCCEHEFVVMTKYDWIFRTYKPYSKCIKCGFIPE